MKPSISFRAGAMETEHPLRGERNNCALYNIPSSYTTKFLRDFHAKAKASKGQGK